LTRDASVALEYELHGDRSAPRGLLRHGARLLVVRVQVGVGVELERKAGVRCPVGVADDVTAAVDCFGMGDEGVEEGGG